MLSFQLLLNFVGIILINIKNNQLLWLMACNLAAQLTSDGAASPCYQNGFPFQITENLFHIYFYRFPSQQILDSNLLHLGHRHLSAYHLVHTGKGLDFTSCLLTDIQDIPSLLRGCCGNCQKNLIDMVFLRAD